MIPRNDGLVPRIQPTVYTSKKEKQDGTIVDKKQPPRVRITRYPILTPAQFSAASSSIHESTQLSKPPVRSRGVAERDASPSSVPSSHVFPVEANLRLYSFIPTLECPEAPVSLQMQLPEYYLQRQKDPASGRPPKEETTRGEEGVNEDDTNNEDAEWVTTAVAEAAGTTRRFRSKHKSRSKPHEPTRCMYTATCPDPNKGTANGEFLAPSATLHLSSVPLSEYEQHTCVLLRPLAGPPVTITAQNPVDNSPRMEPSEVPSVLTALVLEKSLMELRCERVEALAVRGEDTQGISPAWLSSSSTRFKKSEWKSMDAMDMEEARSGGSRWQMEEATDTDRDVIEAEKRHLKKVRTEALQGWSTKEAQAAGADLGDRWGLLNRYRDSHGSSFVAPPKVLQAALASKGDNDQTSMPTPKQPPAAIRLIHRTRSLEESTNSERTKQTKTTIALTTPSMGFVASKQPQSNGSSTSPIPSADQQRSTLKTGHAGDNDSGELAELGEQARQVVTQLLGSEGHTVVSLKELEKLILKRLNSYAGAAEKAKSSATKAEAVRWFSRAQTALKQWLRAENYILDPGGNVTLSVEK